MGTTGDGNWGETRSDRRLPLLDCRFAIVSKWATTTAVGAVTARNSTPTPRHVTRVTHATWAVHGASRGPLLAPFRDAVPGVTS